MHKFLGVLGALVVALALTAVAQATPAGWSDNFNGGAQQAWTFRDGGTGSQALFQNNQLKMSTSSPPALAMLAGYVSESYTDVLMQARVQTVSQTDNYLAYLLARANPATMSGYVLGVGSPGGNSEEHLWLGKLTNGTYSRLADLAVQPDFNWNDCQAELLVIGNTLYGKVWTTGTAEPDWQIQVTDSSYASGVGGVMTATYPTLGWNSVQVAFDDVSA
ncbi:MAG: hypothetical protein IMZ62_10690, partial [Chloroflexi bacterium]|nr:hypothetical protein [Chloroflexota bacterium]